MEVSHKLEQRLLPLFREICSDLKAEMPHVVAEVRSDAGGGNSWYVLSLACYPREDETLHRVSLQVDACSLDSVPKLQALVWWDFYLKYECELFPEPVIASDEAIDEIKKAVPSLVSVLKEAVQRGEPGNNTEYT